MRVRCDADDETPVWRIHLEPGDTDRVVLTGEGLEELDSVLVRAAESPRCRVVVLQSSAGVFCHGMDLRFLLQHAGEDHSDRISSYARCMERLRAHPKATVCLVDGEAMGGGVGVAAAADVMLATKRSSFALPECVLGLIPAMVMPLLLQRMPPQKARWMALSSRTVGATEAAALGLVDEMVEGPIQLEQALRSTIKRLLRANPRAIARLKDYTASIEGAEAGQAMEAGAAQTSRDLLDLDTIAGIRGFLAGDSPAWFERYKSGSRS